MSPDISPEERLLRLIREKREKNKNSEGNLQSQEERNASVSSEAIQKASISAKAINFSNILDLVKIKLVLYIAVAALLGYMTFDFFLTKPNLDLSKFEIGSRDTGAQLESVSTTPKNPYYYYSQRFESRDIFNAPFLGSRIVDDTLDQSIENKIADLSLVGIVLDEEPQAIIENTKEHKTYFFKKGDSLGDIKIADITESKVILNFEEEKFEMTP